MRTATAIGLVFALVFGLFAFVEVSGLNDSLTNTGETATFTATLPTIMVMVLGGAGVLAAVGVLYHFLRS